MFINILKKPEEERTTREDHDHQTSSRYFNFSPGLQCFCFGVFPPPLLKRERARLVAAPPPRPRPSPRNRFDEDTPGCGSKRNPWQPRRHSAPRLCVGRTEDKHRKLKYFHGDYFDFNDEDVDRSPPRCFCSWGLCSVLL